MSLYDNMPNEIAYQKLSGVKDTILNEINKMPFPNADDQSAEKMRKAILKNARECIDGLLERYKASS